MSSTLGLRGRYLPATIAAPEELRKALELPRIAAARPLTHVDRKP
jgi:hypothetical protein